MRNQAFQVRAEAEKQKKLEIVLRQLTGDCLTAQQRLLISRAVGYRKQCRFRLCQESEVLSNIADKENSKSKIQLIFGDTIGEISAPTAVLVRTTGQGGMTNTIYIYLPMLKEGKRDDSQ